MPGAVVKRDVHGDDVRDLEQPGQVREPFNAQSLLDAGVRIGVTEDAAHAERLGAAQHRVPDPAQPDYAPHPPTQARRRADRPPVPAAIQGMLSQPRQRAGERQGQGQGVVGDFLGSVVGNVEEWDGGGVRCRQVDMVIAHAGADHGLTALGSFEELGVQAYPVPQDDVVSVKPQQSLGFVRGDDFQTRLGYGV